MEAALETPEARLVKVILEPQNMPPLKPSTKALFALISIRKYFSQSFFFVILDGPCALGTSGNEDIFAHCTSKTLLGIYVRIDMFKSENIGSDRLDWPQVKEF